MLDGDLKVYSDSIIEPVMKITSTTTSSRGAPVLLVSSLTTYDTTSYLMRFQSQGV